MVPRTKRQMAGVEQLKRFRGNHMDNRRNAGVYIADSGFPEKI